MLKRRTAVPLAKKNQKPSKLRGRHFNYELIEDQNIKKQPNIEVILKTYVEGVGRQGEIVSVRPSVAYNRLLLPDLAAYVTPSNVEKYSVQEKEISEQEKHSSQFAQRVRTKCVTLKALDINHENFQTINMLKKKVFGIIMNKDHPWEIEPWHIRASLRKAGYYILNDSSIELPKQKITGPDLNKEGKMFNVTVTINNTEKAVIKCRIHHWSTDPTGKLPYVPEFHKIRAEPLFGLEEQKIPEKPTVEPKEK